MPDSPPARRILTNAMKPEPEEPPIIAFDRYCADVERDPQWQARQERIRRSGKRRMSPWREIPAVGISVVALLLLAVWIAGLLGIG